MDNQANFDYLDYKENEERLEKLRNQNLSLLSGYLQPANSKLDMM